MPLPDDSPRAEILDEARTLIMGDRNNQYGPPTQDFKRTAALMNAMGYRAIGGRKIKPHDVALLVMAVKFSRLAWMPEKRDSWADMAGYVGCGWECVVEELAKAERKARKKAKKKGKLDDELFQLPGSEFWAAFR